MSWTFGGVAFSWFLPDVNGLPAAPEWQREPILVERNLLGSGNADIASNGYKPYRISGSIFVAQADYAALRALNGTLGILSDGSATWNAVLTLELTPLFVATDGASGTASFVRPIA